MKALQAALVDPDVTGVMDGCGPAVATTCLFQSPIVWHSVTTVYVASQQPVSCVCYPFAHKRKRIHKKKRACVSSLSARVLPLNKTALLPLSSLIFYHTHTQLQHTEWEMFGWHGNIFPKWNKCLAAQVLSNSVGPYGTPLLVIKECLVGPAASVL